MFLTKICKETYCTVYLCTISIFNLKNIDYQKFRQIDKHIQNPKQQFSIKCTQECVVLFGIVNL